MDRDALLWVCVPTLFAYVGSKLLESAKLGVDGPLDQAAPTRINGKIVNVLSLKTDSTRPTLLFIHGLGGCMHQFLYQIKHFRRFANIIAVDNVGNGKSDRPPGADNYTTQSIVNDLLEILRQTNPSSIIIVSHSYGTRIGVKLLLENRNEFNFRAHVMIAPKSHISEHEREAMTKLLAYPDWFVDVIRFMDRIGGIHSLSVKRMLSSSASIELRRQQLIWNKASPTSIMKHYLRGMQWAGKEEYNKIQLPTLIIAGNEDSVTPISPNVDNITEWMPTARVSIIKHVGHNLMLQDPVETNSIIHKFLKDNDLI